MDAFAWINWHEKRICIRAIFCTSLVNRWNNQTMNGGCISRYRHDTSADLRMLSVSAQVVNRHHSKTDPMRWWGTLPDGMKTSSWREHPVRRVANQSEKIAPRTRAPRSASINLSITSVIMPIWEERGGGGKWREQNLRKGSVDWAWGSCPKR